MTPDFMDKIRMRDWERFHNFDVHFKERFLKRLTFKEGFAMFNGLYQFAYPFIEKNKFNLAKIQLLKKRHFIFNKVNESLKATYRPRDLEDIRGILMRQKRKLDIRYIEYWLRLIDKSAKQKGLLIKLFRDLL